MGSSSKTNTVSTGPGKKQLAAMGPQRIEEQYQSDLANPNRLGPQAQGYASDVLGGKYLDPSTNPHLGALTKSITDPIQAGLSAQFSRAGRGTSASSSGLAGAMSQGMASGLAVPLFGQYNQERGLQQGAAQMAGPLDAMQSLPLEQYLERMKGLATLDQSGKTTSSNPTQSIAGIGLAALGAMTANPMLIAAGAGVASGQGPGKIG